MDIEAARLTERMLRDVDAMQEETVALVEALCAIPAPSHREERRAAFISDWLKARGFDAEIDGAKNVLFSFGPEDGELYVVCAHTDTVFPDMEPMPLRREGDRLFCPGVGDDTTNVAAMLTLAAYLKREGFAPRRRVLFAANSCEEGLGNLEGVKAIMRAFGPRVKAFLSLDGGTDEVCSRAVGSARYRVEARTRGGHSFADFGVRNAIEVLARLTCALYGQPLPSGGTTTYNVGMIEGGTSVNAIAQRASMLYEYRSDSAACLEAMERQFRALLAAHTPRDAEVTAELIGERPCAARVEPRAQGALEEACLTALRRYAGTAPALCSGSTDCNIPLSLGVPSACFGVYRGEGAHTREEWVDLTSLPGGMKAALSVMVGMLSA